MNKEKQFAYVELIFYKNVKKHLKKIVKEVVSKDQFYYSDVVNRISGDVTDKAHFTVFYGLEESALNSPELEKLITGTKIQELKLKKLALFEGYQDLYKVLCVEIDDEDENLLTFSTKMLDFKHDKEFGKREFKPHITLAYVQPDYVLPRRYIIEKGTVRVKKVQLSI